MKEFIEKLIGRLEETDLHDIQMVVREVLSKYGFPYESVVQDEVWDALDELSINKFAIKIVNQLAEEYINTSTDTSSGWIDCSERLPNVGVTVLCYWGKSSICENTTSYYYTLMHRNEDNIWISDFGICIGFVIAWMPLPAPYKEGV